MSAKANRANKPGPKPNPEARYVRRLITLAPEVDAELSRLMRLHRLGRAPMVARLIEQADKGAQK